EDLIVRRGVGGDRSGARLLVLARWRRRAQRLGVGRTRREGRGPGAVAGRLDRLARDRQRHLPAVLPGPARRSVDRSRTVERGGAHPRRGAIAGGADGRGTLRSGTAPPPRRGPLVWPG